MEEGGESSGLSSAGIFWDKGERFFREIRIFRRHSHRQSVSAPASLKIFEIIEILLNL